MPYVDHVDEPHFIDLGAKMVKTGDLNPHWFYYPGLVIYLEAAVARLNLLWGTWQGYYTGPESLPDSSHGFALAPDLFSWGRTVIVLISAAVVSGTYGLGRAMFGRGAGLVAGLLMLTSSLHLLGSQHVTSDLVMGAAGLVVLGASWRLVNHAGPGTALLAGVFVGLCAAAKYNGAIVGVVAATAWLLAWSRWPPGESGYFDHRPSFPVWLLVALGMLGAAIAGFLAANSFVVLDWPHWIADFQDQIHVYEPAENVGAMLVSFRSQIQMLWDNEPEMALLGLLGGLVLSGAAITRRLTVPQRRGLLLVMPFPLVYIALMSRFQVTHERNLLIVLPFLSLLGGGGLAFLIKAIAERIPVGVPHALRSSTLITGIVGLALVAAPARDMLAFASFQIMPDSRNLAYDWLRGQLRVGHRIAVESTPWRFCPPGPFACTLPDVYAITGDLTAQGPSWYAERGYDYVMLMGDSGSLLADRARHKPKEKAKIEQYMDLPEVQRFEGNKEGGKGKGPYIVVLKTEGSLSEMKGVTRSGARFGDLAELWGYAYAPVEKPTDYYDPASQSGQAPDRLYRPGEAVGLNLYWRALKDGAGVHGNWSVGVRLTDAAGNVVQRLDIGPVSNWHVWPVFSWYDNAFLAGYYPVPLPPTLPPGAYHLKVTLYDAPSGPALPVSSPGSGPTSELDIGPIDIE